MVNKMVSSTVWGVTQKGANEAPCSHFGMLFVRDVDKGLVSKDTEARNIWFVTAIHFFRGHILKGTGG
jgi:hypothetical protein